ncbi:MAG: YfhO family protein [Lachnospiraceae bacterium]|nr:YfhO family protein [Lachnospiraceae bacterium]
MMTKKNKVTAWARDNRIYIGSFLIPLIILIGVCIAYGVQPFGDKSLVIIDGLHQYMPFFSEYYDKLRNMDSLFYSWNGGLGYNFLALWSYYLSSPLNLLIVFFPKTALNMAVSFLIVLKISLTGLTTASFLISRSQKHNWKVLIFSTAFALSNYMIGYSWNVMWLDSILMLPLVLMGFDRLMKKQDCRMYCWTLALAMIGNFYIAFMICIFLVLWFLFYDHTGIVSFIKNGILFGAGSILGAAMAAIGLIPAYLGIMNTASADMMELPEHSWYTNIWDILSTHLAVTKPITNDNFDGNANLYIGILSIVLLCLYVFGRRISLQSKIKRVLFLGIFIVSFNEQILNFIWHGFHDQYGIPNRFAFLYLFLIMLTGFEVLEKIKAMRWKNVLAALVAAGILGGLMILQSEKEIGLVTIGVSAGVFVLYGLILLCGVIRKLPLKRCVAFLIAAALIETAGCAFYGYSEIGQIEVPKFFSDTEAVNQVKEDIGDDLERTSLLSTKMLDEEIWHNLKCVTMFGSTANGSAVSMMNHLGFYTGANEYLYKGATPLTNLLLNVKYNIRREDDTNLNNFKLVKSYDNMDLLENPYNTYIGYGVEGDLSEWYYESAYPFRVQNDFVWQAYGVDEIFHDIPISDPETVDCEIERTNDGEYTFTNTSSQADNLVFTLPTVGGEDLYIHYDGSQVTNAIVKVNDEIRVSKKINSEIYHIGLIEPGDVVKVYLQLADDDLKQGVVRLSAADFDQAQFDSLYEIMSSTGVRVSSYTSSSIDGTVLMEEDGLVLFSIPYDEGWTVKVDGVETGITAVADGLLAVETEEGLHTLELDYVSPGFQSGLILTIGGLSLFLALCLATVWRRKQKG